MDDQKDLPGCDETSRIDEARRYSAHGKTSRLSLGILLGHYIRLDFICELPAPSIMGEAYISMSIWLPTQKEQNTCLGPRPSVDLDVVLDIDQLA